MGARASLRSAGWQYLVPVILISAPHLDKSKNKRHASVFTKFHAFCLPYDRVLLLDVDLLPRHGTDLSALFDVRAPAGKYHGANYYGPQPEHNRCIPESLMDRHWWCPNAGVLRVDPLPTREEREGQLLEMLKEMNAWNYPSFLPEEYFLAHFFRSWHHIGQIWNYEIGFESNSHEKSTKVARAEKESEQHGSWLDLESDGAQIRTDVLVWHFSGMFDTQPWMFLGIPTSKQVREFASKAWFAARDPGGVLSAAVVGWRQALDELLSSNTNGGDLRVLREAVEILASQVATSRRKRFQRFPLLVPCIRRKTSQPIICDHLKARWKQLGH